MQVEVISLTTTTDANMARDIRNTSTTAGVV